MTIIPLRVIEKILLEIPNSTKREDLSTDRKTVFRINAAFVSIPNIGCTDIHLIDILQTQLEMDWWMVDYIFGQNDIKP